MTIPSRIWRLLRAEVNHRLGKFGSSWERPFYKDSYDRDTYDWQERSGNQDTSSTTGEDAKLARYYRVLELPYGADLASVKAAYKRLMKKYHPDKYQDAKGREAATELVKRINEAYAALSKHLEANA